MIDFYLIVIFACFLFLNFVKLVLCRVYCHFLGTMAGN